MAGPASDGIEGKKTAAMEGGGSSPLPGLGGPEESPKHNGGGGFKVEVTPKEPAIKHASHPAPSADGPIGNPLEKIGDALAEYSIKKILAGLLIAALVIAAAYYVLSVSPSIAVTTVTTTTVSKINAAYLANCGAIQSPGSYYVTSNISTSSQSGACIDVMSSDVAIVCDGKGITGSGPYTNIPPYSYGIRVVNESNVTVNGCRISNFSYGVYFKGSSSVKVLNSNLTTNYVSDLYLNKTVNGLFSDNYLAHSGSPSGAVRVVSYSAQNRFVNNTLYFNSVNGFNISASNNTYLDNYVTGSASSFTCAPLNGFPKSSTAQSNTCTNQTGCDFLTTCKGTNVPLNLSKIILQSTINSCGSIYYPGTYTLGGDINTAAFTSGGKSSGVPCINIAGKGVTLSCNGHTISNASIGLRVGSAGARISGCNIADSNTGLLVSGANSVAFSASRMYDNNVSVRLSGAPGTVLGNLTIRNGTRGIDLENSSTVTVQNFSVKGARVGIYLSNSVGNLFNNGNLTNLQFDVYATPDSANKSLSLMSGTSCSTTDTYWATCPSFVQNATGFVYPLTACTDISRSGSYSLTQNISQGRMNCMVINASDVHLACGGHSILAASSSTGSGISLSGVSNVTISNCTIYNYGVGINVSDSSNFSIHGYNGISLANYGIAMRRSVRGLLYNNSVNGTSNASVLLSNVSLTSVVLQKLTGGVKKNIGIEVSNSKSNFIDLNTGLKNYVGLSITGNSNNNTVSNNTFTASSQYDFFCDQQNSGMASENGGINYGAVKAGCHWMAAIASNLANLGCASSSGKGTSYYPITSDNVYGFGSTCFGLYANYSTVNCNGHTIIATNATNGGTFAALKNAKSLTVENCYLKGFSSPIVVNNASSPTVSNLTIYSSVNSTAISVTNLQSPTIKDNNVLDSGTGLYEGNVMYGTVLGNNVTGFRTAFVMNTVFAQQITRNNVTSVVGTALAAYNSTSNIFTQNRFSGPQGGLLCTLGARSASNNSDEGFNYCSSNQGCAWVSQSKSLCP